MHSRWNDSEAKKYLASPLEMRAYTSRLLGEEDSLVLHGGGNTSLKHTIKDLFSKDIEILYVKGSGHDLKTIQSNGFSPTRQDYLKQLSTLPSMTDSVMMRELKCSQIDPSAPAPSVEAILHAIIPFKYVDHTHADAVVAISNSPGGEAKLREVYGERVLILPYIMPGFILAKQVYEATLDLNWSKIDGMVLLHHGVFTFNDDAKKSYEMMINLVDKSEKYLMAKNVFTSKHQVSTSKQLTSATHLAFARSRKLVSALHGSPVLARLDQSSESVHYASLPNVSAIATRGPITPDHVIHTKRVPALFDASKDIGEIKVQLDQFAKDYRSYFDRNKSEGLICLDQAPRYAVWKNLGIASYASNAKRLQVINDIAAHTLQAVQWGEGLGGWEPLDEKNIFDLEYWELEQAKLKKSASAGDFDGKIALVTGAASGIGLAACQELLARGCAVVGLDIDTKVVGLFNSLAYLGIKTDVTDSKAIEAAVNACVLAFGGLDHIVSNAGNFPKSALIEDTAEEMWQRSMDLNLSSHFLLLKHAAKYLKEGVNSSIVFVGSKNVPAPGPKASSYSVAKAGMAQLARVAAFELGEFGVRVNMVHPNAVFDTGIWDEATLRSRADSYKLSVDEYKRNNVLKAEITSKHVAQTIVELLGPRFAKTTGAQIPIDGGDPRVI
jgi:rhamnose utilization protein RhaD (predicted bifunctional aldolase and dehydrogenase)/NAD(P)-dependent dehydrogenase (short-subunit alcohol dehydrogenase family)